MMMFLVIAAAGGIALWGMQAVQAPGPLSQPNNVIIEHGRSTPEIAVLLENTGVVSDHRLFVLATYLTRATGGNLKAGEYAFPAGASLAQVLAIIRSGRAVVHKVAVPEGWTSTQVVERVNGHPALTGTITDIPPEGSLLPDTYVFQRGASRDALIARMSEAQEALLDELWSKRAPDLPIRTKEEALILASIVEKETGVAEERQQVAAVFINRLRRNMRLQSDPTIIYGITAGQGRLDRPISRGDISQRTPYNTYRIDGLPPTPIANPGRQAIAAVLQPGTADHLYFVADGSGGHVFARTLKEHQENVRRWRKIEQAVGSEGSQADESPIPVTAEAEKAPEVTEVEKMGEEEAENLPAAAVAVEASAAPDPPSEAPSEAQVGAPSEVLSEAPTETPAETPTEAPSNAPAEESQPAARAATPRPKPQQTGPVVTLAERAVPIPKPKPQRN